MPQGCAVPGFRGRVALAWSVASPGVGERIYTLAEAAEETGISLSAIRDGCRAGRIPHRRSGDGTARVHRVMTQEHVDWLVASRTVQPVPVLDPMEAVIAATRAALERNRGRRRPR